MSGINSKNIDLGIIEDLKRRRGLSRVRGEDLEQRREEIIQQVQRNIFQHPQTE